MVTTTKQQIELNGGKVFPVSGHSVTLYPISELASALGRSTQTVRKWEANQVIPKAAFRDKAKKRLYSREQIELIVHVADTTEIRQGLSMEETDFSKRIFDEWKKVTTASIKNSPKVDK